MTSTRGWRGLVMGCAVLAIGGLTGCDCGGGDGPPASDAGPGDAFVPEVDAGTDAFVPEVDAGTDAGTDAFVPDAGGCPDVLGVYEAVTSTGDCGGWDMGAMQSIVEAKSGVMCEVFFESNVPKRIPGINGDATIGADGSFSGAELSLGFDAPVMDCSGTWNAVAETMTVSCLMPMDCVIELHRTGPLP